MWKSYLIFELCTFPTKIHAVARGAVGYASNNLGKDDENEFIIDRRGIARGAGHGSGDNSCHDTKPDCLERSIDQGCIIDFTNMLVDCRRTCLLCGNQIENKVYAIYNDEPQDIPIREHSRRETLDAVRLTQEYMVDLYQNPMYADVATRCKNLHASCSFWSTVGECENNPIFMEVNCAPACQTCSKILFENRCPVNRELLETSVWEPGDLNRMFERIVSDPEWQAYNLQILSQPEPRKDTENILKGPWVITLDDFLTSEECETLIRLGADKGYERSEDLSDQMNLDGTFDGYVSEFRTSTNAWCDGPCMEHPLTQAVHDRIERLIDIPIPNYEDLQLLRYEEGQKYGIHHDFIDSQVDRQPGPRVRSSRGTRVDLLFDLSDFLTIFIFHIRS